MGVKVREKPEGSGQYWIFVNHQGKRKSKKVGSEKAALEAAKKIEAKLVLNEFDMIETKKKSVNTFKEYSTKWLEGYIKPLRRDSTYNRYKEVLNIHVYPDLADIPIDEIKRKIIRDILLKKHNTGSSRAGLALIRDVISGTLFQAVEDEIIDANPVTGILKRLNLQKDKREAVKPFLVEEVDLFLDTCKKMYPEHYAFFLCLFRTGMRLGEALALSWDDVDFNGKFVEVKRSFRRGIVTKPKNGKERRVDLSDMLLDELKALLILRKKEALKKGLGDPVEIIFHRDNTYMDQKHIRRIYKRILKKAGMRQMRLHDTRHTYASLLLSYGESPVYVKEQLGHSSIDITVDIYGHLIPSSNRNAVNKLDCKTMQTDAPGVQNHAK